MIIKELYEIISQLVAAGHGEVPVLFDTEAQTYHYHMETVDSAHLEEDPYLHLCLASTSPHHTCGPNCEKS